MNTELLVILIITYFYGEYNIMNLFKSVLSVFSKTESGLLPMVDNNVEVEVVDDGGVKVELGVEKSPKKPKQKYTKSYSKLKKDLSGVIVSDKVYNYTEKLSELMKVGRDSYISMVEKRIETTYYFIQIGNTLLEAKSELSKTDFDLLCKNLKVSERSISRYLSFVSDDRVSKLTMKQLMLIKKPSKEKLSTMSGLTDNQFSEVLKGNDKSYNELVKKLKADKLKDMKSPYANITDKVYKDCISEGIEYTLDLMSEANGKLKNSENMIKKLKQQLSELKPKPTTAANNSNTKTKKKVS